MANDLLDGLSLEGMADSLSDTSSNEVQTTETENTPVDQASSAVTTGNGSNYTITLDRPKFSKMTNALKLIENICSDCQIKGGMVRTKTDNRKSIITLDLTSIIEDKDIMFSFLKGKLALLKTFELDMDVQADDNSIIIQSTNDYYEFCDCFSKMQFRKPVEDFLDNRYLDDATFAPIINGCTEDALIFNYTVSKYVRSRMAKIGEGFKVDSIKFTFHGDHACFGIETKSKDNVSKNATTIQTLKNISGKSFALINMPFTIAIESDMKISCYNLSNDFAMCKCELDFAGIPIVIYAKVKFISDNT